MSKNALFDRFPARVLVLCLGLTLTVTSAACKSTSAEEGCGPDRDEAGSVPSWCDWEVLERSSSEPEWKNEVSNANLEFFGEGFGPTEEEARAEAEANMRGAAARYLETKIDSDSVVVIEGDKERGASRTQASTDKTVSGMAVSDFYWERRKRIGYHHGEQLQQFDYRVLVKGKLRQ